MAQPCAQLSEPSVADYDTWQDWIENVVLREYGLCAARHKETVASWPK